MLASSVRIAIAAARGAHGEPAADGDAASRRVPASRSSSRWSTRLPDGAERWPLLARVGVLRRWLEPRVGLTLTPDEVRELLAVVFAIRKTVEAGPMLDEALERILTRPQLDLSVLEAGEQLDFEEP
jgi:hypothetical protein